jgi:hypothetical protein
MRTSSRYESLNPEGLEVCIEVPFACRLMASTWLYSSSCSTTAAPNLTHIEFLLLTQRFPPQRSLQHYCLRTFAIHWEELSEYEQHYIPALPVALKEAQLSYLTLYGSKGCLDFKSLKILFQNDGESTAGWDEVRSLDLTELISDHFTINDVGKCLKRRAISVSHGMERLSLGT